MKRTINIVLIIAAVALAACLPALAGFDDQFMESGDIGQNKVPAIGFSRVLFIPVIVDEAKTPDMKRWETFFENKLDALTFKHFWNVNSVGRYDVEVTMIDPIHYEKCPLPAEYKGCAIPRGDASALEPGVKFMKDLISRVRKERGINFADFDVNGPKGIPDGWVDGVVVMTNADFPGVAFPVSLFKKFEVDNVKIGAVAIASLFDEEIVAVHEFGHLLGFGDLYHEHKPGRGLYLSLMGQYDDGIPLIDAYSRVKIGWADIIDIPEGTPVSDYFLPPAETSGEVLRIGRGKEFFLVENRAPGKFFDRKIKSPGLAVYHIDETTLPIPGKWSFVQLIQNCLNCNEWRPLIMNEVPGGKFDVQFGNGRKVEDFLFHKGASFSSDYSDQTPISESHPVWNSNFYSGEPSDVLLYDVDDQSSLPAIKFKIGYK